MSDSEIKNNYNVKYQINFEIKSVNTENKKGNNRIKK